MKSISRWDQLDEPTNSELVLKILQDEDCRQLMEALATDHLTAKELARCCDIPLSTVYRKLEFLDDANIVEESTQIDPTLSHVSEYHLTIEAFTISVDMEEELTIEVSTTD